MDNSYTRKDWWKGMAIILPLTIFCAIGGNGAGPETAGTWALAQLAIGAGGTIYINMARAEQFDGSKFVAVVAGLFGPLFSLYYGIKRDPQVVISTS